MKNKCENCLHKGICKLEERFKEFIDEHDKPTTHEEDVNFEIEVKCKEFLSKDSPMWPFGTKDIPTTVPNAPTPKHPCEGCLIYEQLKKGQPISTDSCYWCSKNPNKITCIDTLTTSVSDGQTNIKTVSKVK